MSSAIDEILGSTDILIALSAAVISLVVIPLVFHLLSRLERLEGRVFLRTFLNRIKWPLAIVFAVAFIHVSSFDDIFQRDDVASDIMVVMLIIALTWAFIRFANIIKMVVHEKYPIDHPDNLDERKIRTRYQYIHTLVTILISLIGASLIFFQFDELRIIGAGILASAGVAALVIAFTAQKTLSNLIAGFQIAFTQPFRLDDVVIVEGEWGKIEEITMTYVVVRIWDQRRLVLPISYFIEKPFQNWTRTSAEILGTVMIYVDYTVPVEIIREELKEIVKKTGLWDEKVVGLQVTEASERTVTLRALVSARNASDAWDLRCLVREKLLEFLKREYPGSLPKIRIDEAVTTKK